MSPGVTHFRLSSALAPPAWPLHAPLADLGVGSAKKSQSLCAAPPENRVSLHGQALQERRVLHSITPLQTSEGHFGSVEGAGGFFPPQGTEISRLQPWKDAAALQVLHGRSAL